MTKTLLLSTALVVALPGLASAQSAADILDEIISSAVFELKAAGKTYTRDLPSEGNRRDDRTEVLSSLSISTEAVLDEDYYTWITGDLVVSYSSAVDYGEGVFRRPNDLDPVAHYVDIRSLMLNREILEGDGEIFVGKGLVEMGLGELYSPADRFNMVIAPDPTESDDHGVWQIGVKRFFEDDTFSYRFIPVHEQGAGPNGDSRWLGSSGDAIFTDLPEGVDSDAIVDDLADPKLKNTSHLFSYSAVRDGYDWFGFLHHGQSAFPILERREEITLTNLNPEVFKITPTATTVGGGASFVIDEWKLFGEASYQVAKQSKDQDFVLYSFGGSYRDTEFANSIGIDEIKPILEYGGEWVVSSQKESQFLIANSQNARAVPNTILSKLEVQVDDDWSGALAVTYNLNDDDNLVTAGVRYKYDDNLEFSAAYTQFNGPEGSYYGNWAQNDFVRVDVEYKF